MRIVSVAVTLVAVLSVHQSAQALEVFDETDADTLASILFPGTDGLVYTSGNAVLNGHFDAFANASSSAVFTNATGTYGIGNGSGAAFEGIVLSTGVAIDYSDGPNFDSGHDTIFSIGATPAQQGLLQPITNQPDMFDVTELNISFTNTTGSVVPFELFAVFGSDEFPEFINSGVNDGFGAYLNGTNIAFANGSPLNIEHPNMAPFQGTELDGIIAPINTTATSLDPRLFLSGTAQPGLNNLTLIIADAGDDAVDSTVYLSRETISGPVSGEPVFPDSIDPVTGGFTFDDIDLPGGDTIFLDPDVAIGYDYEVNGSAATPDPKFATVMVNPTINDSNFLISYGSVVDQLLIAGNTLNLTVLEPGGVDAFMITGIEPSSLLDPTNTLAFVTGVTFTTDIDGVTVTQTPIVIDFVIPEPASLSLLLSVVVPVLMRRRRG